MGTSRLTVRKWLGRLAYALFLVLVVEFALQAWYYISSGGLLFSRAAVPIFTTDPYSVWAVKPNLSFHHATNEFSIDIFTNSEGFRSSSAGEEYARPAAEDLFRIIVLGPSFAFGWGVDHEQTFTQVLQTRLVEAGFGDGRPIQVINRGIPALPACHNLEWYRQIGRTYEPDLVIQFMYGSLMPGCPPDFHVDEDGFLRDGSMTGLQRFVARAKMSGIAFYSWTAYTGLRSKWLEPGTTETIVGAGRDLSIREAFDPDGDEVRSAELFYADLQQTVEASGARLLVFHFPLSYIVHREDVARWRHLGVRDPDQHTAYNEAFARHLEHEGYRILNGTDGVRAYAEATGQRLYFWLDVHWTAEGNAAAAGIVADYLMDNREWAVGTAD